MALAAVPLALLPAQLAFAEHDSGKGSGRGHQIRAGHHESQTTDKGKRGDKGKHTPVRIQVLNVSDFHGQLDPLSVFGVGEVGGAAALSSYFATDRKANPNTLLLTAGDAVGASPPLSSFFQDRPTIQWMTYAGVSPYKIYEVGGVKVAVIGV